MLLNSHYDLLRFFALRRGLCIASYALSQNKNSSPYRQVISCKYLRKILGLIGLLFILSAQGAEQTFSVIANISAYSDKLTGDLTLTLDAGETVYHPFLRIQGQSSSSILPLPKLLKLGDKHQITFFLPSPHAYPGQYHLLVELIFQDKSGAWLSSPMGMIYQYHSNIPAAKLPSVSIKGHHFIWKDIEHVERLRLQLTASPAWESTNTYRPKDRSFKLEPSGLGSALANYQYPQLIRLGWLENGIHQSHVIPWVLQTNALAEPEWRSGYLLKIAEKMSTYSVLGLAIAFIFLSWLLSYRPIEWCNLPNSPMIHWLLPVGLSLWMAQCLQFEYWSTPTLSTGGDIGSHIFYAHVFEDWLSQGKISGWLPEVFMGLPAFQYYFPLPFILMALLANITGMAIAFKWLSLLPAVLMPLAVYWTTGRWQWPVMARWFAVLGVCGFLLTNATSIWGGNILSMLAGEFSYAWGLLFSLLLLGAFYQALQKGGRYWILAVLCEFLVALSHGYALLFSGFAVFTLIVFAEKPWQSLKTILFIHTLTFLLLAFWLFPLFEHHAWTIANDTFFHLNHWQTLWPVTIMPFLLGIGAWCWLMFKLPASRVAFTLPVMFALVAWVLFLLAQTLHLAEIRFYPYIQVLLLITFSGALGYLIQHYRPSMGILLPLGLCLLASLFWQAEVKQVGDWAKWNLQGYEAKPLWPAFKAIADDLKGDLDQPRIAFEHDPANHDLGSTRNLEALPLFGTRPVLEGLYMESAIAGPFIYQLQAEISQRPSSPLSRYPSVKDSAERAIEHMKVLYTDTLLLRSKEMKQRFSEVEDLKLISQHGPFRAYQLKQPLNFVEVVTQPLIARDRVGWLEQSFQRFRLKVPYQEREVYLKSGEALPIIASIDLSPPIVTEIEREEIRFTTKSVGKPHLIKMAYHPKWQSQNGETIYLIEPAFMLIYPKTEQVALSYGLTWVDKIGRISTLLGIILVWVGWFVVHPSIDQMSKMTERLAFSVILILLFAWIAYAFDTERHYEQGHEFFKERQWLEAAEAFKQASENRPIGAPKAEALFWSGRAYQIAGKASLATGLFKQLVDQYPANFWAIEGLYRLIELSDSPHSDRLQEQMQRDYAGSYWAKKLVDEP